MASNVCAIFVHLDRIRCRFMSGGNTPHDSSCKRRKEKTTWCPRGRSPLNSKVDESNVHKVNVSPRLVRFG